MKYVSTRGSAPVLTFDDVLLTGLARDGGLYVPESWPQLSAEQLRAFASMPYAAVAVEVMWPFVEGTIERDAFESIVRDEGIDYARRLTQAGVPTELHLSPGTFHGSSGVFPQTAISNRIHADYTAAIRRALDS